MRSFKQGNWDPKNATGDKIVCPVCKTDKKGEVVLLPIRGKQKGNNCQAIQVHLSCLELWIDLENKWIYQKYEN
jgi:hypothetical protein